MHPLSARACVLLEGVPPQERVASLCSRAASAVLEHGMSRAQAEAGFAAVFRSREIGEETAAYAMTVKIVRAFLRV